MRCKQVHPEVPDLYAVEEEKKDRAGRYLKGQLKKMLAVGDGKKSDSLKDSP